MELSNLNNPDSDVREASLDEICSSIESGALSAESIADTLLPKCLELASNQLGATDSDSVFGRSFSLIVLATIIEQDRQQKLLTEAQFAQIHEFCLHYMAHEKDFRGYLGAKKGWAHSVAHLSDLLVVYA